MTRASSWPRERLKHPIERVPLEQIAELQVLPEHVETLVAAEPFELGRMFAAVHARGEGRHASGYVRQNRAF